MKIKLYALVLILGTLNLAIAAPEIEDSINQQFREALNKRDSGDLYAAIEALKKLLVASPQLNRARLELAVAYYRAALFDEAMKNAQAVLDAPDTPPDVKETVRLFMDELVAMKEAEEKTRHNFSGFVSMGIGHDNNVNAGPSGDIFTINGAEFILDKNSTSSASMYGQFTAHLDHSYRIPGTASIAGESVTAFWQSYVELYRRSYDDKGLNNGYSLDVLSASTGPAVISRNDWRAAMIFNVDYIRLGDDPLATYTSLNPSFTKVFGSNDITVHGKVGYRRFMTNKNNESDLEGMRYAIGVDWGHQYNEDWFSLVGTNFYTQNGRKSYEEYDVHEIYASVFWQGWEGGSVYGRAGYTDTRYDGKELGFDLQRNEYTTNVLLGVTHEFKNSDGWSINAQVNYTENSTRIPLYHYYRTDGLVELIKRF